MWQTVMVGVLRELLKDSEEPYTYSDTALEKLLLSSARLVQFDTTFSTSYAVDTEGLDITPDPSGDNPFVVLTCLRAACVLGKGEAAKSAGQAIAVRDGSSSIDLRGNLTGRLELMKSACEEYRNAKNAHALGRSVSVGQAVLTPSVPQSDVKHYGHW